MAKQSTYIGEMDELISILEPTETVDSTGGVATTWDAIAENLWAKVENSVRSDEGLEGEQITAVNVKIFTIWYRTDITEKMRVMWRGKEANIITLDMVGRNQYTRIEAQIRDNET